MFELWLRIVVFLPFAIVGFLFILVSEITEYVGNTISNWSEKHGPLAITNRQRKKLQEEMRYYDTEN